MAGVDTGLEQLYLCNQTKQTVAISCSRLHLKTSQHLLTLSTFLHKEYFKQGVAPVWKGLTLDWNTTAMLNDGTELGLHL